MVRYKIQETLFKVDMQIYNSVTLALGYFVDKHIVNGTTNFLSIFSILLKILPVCQ